MFFIIEKPEETLNFSQNFVSIIKMEIPKIINLLNDWGNEEAKFTTKKWYVIESQTAKGKYNHNNSIKFETEKILNQVFVIILMHLF